MRTSAHSTTPTYSLTAALLALGLAGCATLATAPTAAALAAAPAAAASAAASAVARPAAAGPAANPSSRPAASFSAASAPAGAASAAAGPPVPGQPPAFATVIKDAKKTEGLIAFWQKDEKVWL